MPLVVDEVVWITEKAGLTADGGFAVRMTNKTGAVSIKGTTVDASTGTDNAFTIAAADTIDPIGVVFERGIADGDECWVTVSGRCLALLEDGSASTHGNWVAISTTAAGRVDMSDGSPPNATRHFQEMGHCLESQSAGTAVLAAFMMHFN